MFLLLFILFHFSAPLIAISHPYERERIWCEEASSDDVLVRMGSQYLNTDCVMYAIPYINLTAKPCPIKLTNITEMDNNCYQLFSHNNTIQTLNIKVIQPPTLIQTVTGVAQTLQPFNGEVFTLHCPLYGIPRLEYSWTVPVSPQQFMEINTDKLNVLKNEMGAAEALGNFTITSDLYPASLSVDYYSAYGIDGEYHCTGKNEFGQKTILVAEVNNGSLCVSGNYRQFKKRLDLEENHKVSLTNIGTNVTLTCRLAPFSSNIRMAWILTSNLPYIKSLCTDTLNKYPYIVTGERYREVSQLESGGDKSLEEPRCIKANSLIIQEFKPEDDLQYSCVAQVCSAANNSELTVRTVAVTSDTNTIRRYRWIFSAISLPLVAGVIITVSVCIIMYLYKVKIVRWYIAWKREEPKRNFEFDVFICTPEEYKEDFVAEVNREVINYANNFRVLWSESAECNLAGATHYTNATRILKKCRKFVFIVDERFQDCCFSRQLVELVTEKSSVENVNIILPVKWCGKAVVPRDLMVYRYVERVRGRECFREIEDFIEGRRARTKTRRRTTYTHRVMFYSHSHNEHASPLINV